MTQPCDLDATDARRLIGTKALSPVELLDSCLARIAATNGTLNAVVAMDEAKARADAKEAEAAVMRGDHLGILRGLPVGIKDLDATAGLRTTYGSLIHEHDIPDTDAGVVARVRAAGANIFAKTNTPEFGAGANTTNRVYGATGNPFDADKTSAGSSGGSAAALAVGMMPLATGSDYGGSLRTPAGFCGVTGFRPSPGVVPATGRPVSINPFSVLGPMGRTVADTHLLLRAQIGHDPRDPFSQPCSDIPDILHPADLSSLRVAISPDLGCCPVDEGIAEVFRERTAIFRHHFREAQDRDPKMEGVHDAFEITRGMNFVGAHRERLEKHRDKLDRNVIDNTERGLQYSLGDVAWAHQTQTRIYTDFIDLFDEIDILICPTASVTPFPHSQLFVEEINGEPMPTYMRWLALSYALTMALPAAASLPCGVDQHGMPFGIQVVGPRGSDARVLAVSLALEQAMASNSATARPLPSLEALSA